MVRLAQTAVGTVASDCHAVWAMPCSLFVNFAMSFSSMSTRTCNLPTCPNTMSGCPAATPTYSPAPPQPAARCRKLGVLRHGCRTCNCDRVSVADSRCSGNQAIEFGAGLGQLCGHLPNAGRRDGTVIPPRTCFLQFQIGLRLRQLCLRRIEAGFAVDQSGSRRWRSNRSTCGSVHTASLALSDSLRPRRFSLRVVAVPRGVASDRAVRVWLLCWLAWLPGVRTRHANWRSSSWNSGWPVCTVCPTRTNPQSASGDVGADRDVFALWFDDPRTGQLYCVRRTRRVSRVGQPAVASAGPSSSESWRRWTLR